MLIPLHILLGLNRTADLYRMHVSSGYLCFISSPRFLSLVKRDLSAIVMQQFPLKPQAPNASFYVLSVGGCCLFICFQYRWLALLHVLVHYNLRVTACLFMWFSIIKTFPF